MARVLHLIQSLSRGGAARAMTYIAKYTSRLDSYEHAVAGLSAADAHGIELAKAAGMRVIPSNDWSQIIAEMETADIVHAHWWNCPEFNLFFRKTLPPMRLIAWFHVAGDKAPQIVTNDVVNFVDIALACSPHTFLCPGIQALSPEMREKKAGMAYGAADFERLDGFTPRPHKGFNVGYIGTVHYLKMHPDFAKLSAAVDVPEIKFIVCGSGDGGRCERDAQSTGRGDRFDFRGHVEDITSVIEILDVYGYPLCEDTYAAAEVNLQEVMFAGLPVVVFPYGGVKHLVQHNETGLIVNSAAEYKSAIEFLYNNPDERARLGRNAHRYAKDTFGAENASRVIHRHYQTLLAGPKRQRVWGKDVERSLLEQTVTANDLRNATALPGHELFLQSLGDAKIESMFRATLSSDTDQILFHADEQLFRMSELMRSSGVRPYRRAFRDDAVLAFWSGLTYQAEEEWGAATADLFDAVRSGCNHWRIAWYLAQNAIKASHTELAQSILQLVVQARPDFQPARELQSSMHFQ